MVDRENGRYDLMACPVGTGIWTEEPATGRAGGIYLFETRAAAEAYHAMHATRLAARGVTGIEATYRGVNEALTRIDRGPIR